MMGLKVYVPQFLRTQTRPTAETPFDNNMWFDLDFASLANGAAWVKSYASALLYLEVSLERDRKSQGIVVGMDIDMEDELGASGEHEQQKLTARSALLMEIYRGIDDADEFEGVIASDSEQSISDIGVLIQKHETAGDWRKVFHMRETQLKMASGQPSSDLAAHLGLMTSMERLGYNHLLDLYARSVSSVDRWAGDEQRELEELHCESLWKCERWDYNVQQMHAGLSGAGGPIIMLPK